jgi:hypothetical protein
LIDSYAEGLIDKQAFEPRITRLRLGLSTCVETLPHPISMWSHNKTVSKHWVRE